jgi:hypothetical protein
MEHNLENSTVVEHPPESPYPPPAHFDAERIAAAQPVEPLAARQEITGLNRLWRRFPKGRPGLVTALLIALFSAALGGMILGLHDGVAEPRANASPAGPIVVDQTGDEAPKPPAPARSVKINNPIPPDSKRALSVPPVTVDPASADKEPVARKVSELVLRWEKEDRKDRRKAERHRPKDNNDDH